MSGLVVILVAFACGLLIGAGMWLVDEHRWDRAREQVRREHPELFPSEES